MKKHRTTWFAAMALGAAAFAASCGSSKAPGASGPGAGPAADAGPSLFSPVPPAVYVAKVKNLLVALPPTDDEVQAVVKDPSALGGLIDGWMKLPQYSEKMQTFFELSFQQTQITIADLADQAYPKQAAVNPFLRGLLARNVKESFARTVLALNAEGRPFTETMTTERFMLTPALLEFLAFLDAWQVSDEGKITDRFKVAHPSVQLTVEAAQGPIPLSETLDPQSPNYMHWYDPDIADATKMTPGCTDDPVVLGNRGDALHFLLYGSLVTHQSASGVTCQQYAGSVAAPQMTQDDFANWKMVTVRAPNAGESPTPFYDLNALRSATELVVTIPRVGFFSTPAFFANWQTNTSNQMRVTINQALIVATGAMVDGFDTTVPDSTPGLDAAHAGDGACLTCHQTLDPTRSILAATYSWNYHNQADTAFSGQKGLFAFQGKVAKVGSVRDLGATFASHPRFGTAWVQKLCYYANSTACDETDPEFTRVEKAFEASSYSWDALVREFFQSPLTTGATETKTTRAEGSTVAVSRRDHLCAALDARFGFTDVCGLSATTKLPASQTIPAVVAGLPSDGYGRGAVAPVLPNEPTLFYRAGMENICETVAARVVDPKASVVVPNQKTWTGTDPDAAIADFLQIVMALTPSDARYEKSRTLLRGHFDDAVATKVNATDALRSTFVVACLSPSALAIGM